MRLIIDAHIPILWSHIARLFFLYTGTRKIGSGTEQQRLVPVATIVPWMFVNRSQESSIKATRHKYL